MLKKILLALVIMTVVCPERGDAQKHNEQVIDEGTIHSDNNKLIASPGTLDFGECNEGDVIERDFRIYNKTGETVTIRSASPSCGCVTTLLQGNTIQPQSYIDIGMHFETQGRWGKRINCIIIQHSLIDEPPLRVNLVGYVRPLIKITPDIVYFEKVKPGQSYTKDVRVESEVLNDINIAHVKNSFNEITTELLETRDGVSYLRVTIMPRENSGFHSAQLGVVFDNPKITESVIIVKWQIFQHIVAAPGSILVVIPSEPSTIKRNVILKATDDVPFEILGTECNLSGLQVQYEKKIRSVEHEINLLFQPITFNSDMIDFMLKFRSDHPESEFVTVPILLYRSGDDT